MSSDVTSNETSAAARGASNEILRRENELLRTAYTRMYFEHQKLIAPAQREEAKLALAKQLVSGKEDQSVEAVRQFVAQYSLEPVAHRLDGEDIYQLYSRYELLVEMWRDATDAYMHSDASTPIAPKEQST